MLQLFTTNSRTCRHFLITSLSAMKIKKFVICTSGHTTPISFSIILCLQFNWLRTGNGQANRKRKSYWYFFFQQHFFFFYRFCVFGEPNFHLFHPKKLSFITLKPKRGAKRYHFRKIINNSIKNYIRRTSPFPENEKPSQKHLKKKRGGSSHTIYTAINNMRKQVCSVKEKLNITIS